MGIDILLYRARIGSFSLQRHCIVKHKSSHKYNPNTSGTDIHLRSFACSVVALWCFTLLLIFHRSRSHIIETYASSVDFRCQDNQHLTSLRGTIPDIYTCGNNIYASYASRMLLLAADIELNPGPTEDTQLILNAISDIQESLSHMKNEIIGVKNEMSKVQTELTSIKSNIQHLETNQTRTNRSIGDIQRRLDSIEYNNEILDNDMRAISMHDEVSQERIERIERHINVTESDRLKGSLRIFGLQEQENEQVSLETHVNESVFSAAPPNAKLNENSIKSVKRVGKMSNKPRLVIVEFNDPDDKFKLLKYRDNLRAAGIRLSSDLSYLQRQQLKEVNNRGLRGYFKNGKLVTYMPNQSNRQQTDNSRRFVHANRQSYAGVVRGADPVDLNYNTSTQGDSQSGNVHVNTQ
ncbi:hypothetical protein ACF0H5_001167 [Mactra antiquata]